MEWDLQLLEHKTSCITSQFDPCLKCIFSMGSWGWSWCSFLDVVAVDVVAVDVVAVDVATVV